MRNHSFPFWVVLALLVDGVLVAVTDEVKPVSVMKGDSVTLNTGVSDLQSDNTIEWIFGDKLIIAKMDGKKISIIVFRDKLNLDSENGSLIIKDITNEQEGLYKVDIRGRYETSKRFNVTVRDVVESLSVKEGDTVTLHTGVIKKQRDDQILWKFGEKVINTDRLNGDVDAIRSNIHLNDQTGDLHISNIRRDQTGDYKVEINTSSMILHRKLYIAVEGMMNVSVMEGESVTLRTGVIEIQGHDLILWKFEDHLIAEINKETNQFILNDSGDVRFKDRLQPNEKTGSLIISKSRITDSGVYHLHMSNSTYTIQRTISVTVSAVSVSLRDLAMILSGGGVVLLVGVLIALGIYCFKKSKQETQSKVGML